jgi:hypothetical protein
MKCNNTFIFFYHNTFIYGSKTGKEKDVVRPERKSVIFIMKHKLIMKCLIYNFELFERIYRARVCDLHHEAQAHHKVFNVSLSCLIEYIFVLSLYIVLNIRSTSILLWIGVLCSCLRNCTDDTIANNLNHPFSIARPRFI